MTVFLPKVDLKCVLVDPMQYRLTELRKMAHNKKRYVKLIAFKAKLP